MVSRLRKPASISFALALCLATIAAFIIFSAVLLIAVWYDKTYPSAPLPSSEKTKAVRFPDYREKAVQALTAFAALDATRQQHLRNQVQRALHPVADWIASRHHRSFSLLCIGENHHNATRRYLAAQLFNRLRFDTLHLETVPTGLATIQRKLAANVDYYPLLNADITHIITAAQTRNPALQIFAIDETAVQRRQRLLPGHPASRERAIELNFFNSAQPNQRAVVLFGGLHCQDSTGWFFHHAKRRRKPHADNEFVNLRVLDTHHDGPVEGWAFFVSGLGATVENYVLDTRQISDPSVLGWFGLFNQRYLTQYRYLLLFSENEA